MEAKEVWPPLLPDSCPSCGEKIIGIVCGCDLEIGRYSCGAEYRRGFSLGLVKACRVLPVKGMAMTGCELDEIVERPR